jgi:hypothetical protein
MTHADWVEIYYALEYKLMSPAVVGDKEWEDHLNAIMDEIGEDGKNMEGTES